MITYPILIAAVGATIIITGVLHVILQKWLSKINNGDDE